MLLWLYIYSERIFTDCANGHSDGISGLERICRTNTSDPLTSFHLTSIFDAEHGEAKEVQAITESSKSVLVPKRMLSHSHIMRCVDTMISVEAGAGAAGKTVTMDAATEIGTQHEQRTEILHNAPPASTLSSLAKATYHSRIMIMGRKMRCMLGLRQLPAVLTAKSLDESWNPKRNRGGGTLTRVLQKSTSIWRENYEWFGSGSLYRPLPLHCIPFQRNWSGAKRDQAMHEHSVLLSRFPRSFGHISCVEQPLLPSVA